MIIFTVYIAEKSGAQKGCVNCPRSCPGHGAERQVLCKCAHHLCFPSARRCGVFPRSPSLLFTPLLCRDKDFWPHFGPLWGTKVWCFSGGTWLIRKTPQRGRFLSLSQGHHGSESQELWVHLPATSLRQHCTTLQKSSAPGTSVSPF